MHSELGDELERSVQAAMRCTACGPIIKKKLESCCIGCGDEWVKEDFEMSLVGNDVIALFPNIQSKSTGKIIRDEVERSPMVIEGFNYKLGVTYIAMNKEYTGDLKPMEKFLPWRKKVKGVTPGMKNRWVNRKKDEAKDSQWCYPKAKPNETQKTPDSVQMHRNMNKVSVPEFHVQVWRRNFHPDERRSDRSQGDYVRGETCHAILVKAVQFHPAQVKAENPLPHWICR